MGEPLQSFKTEILSFTLNFDVHAKFNRIGQILAKTMSGVVLTRVVGPAIAYEMEPVAQRYYKVSSSLACNF